MLGLVADAADTGRPLPVHVVWRRLQRQKALQAPCGQHSRQPSQTCVSCLWTCLQLHGKPQEPRQMSRGHVYERTHGSVNEWEESIH